MVFIARMRAQKKGWDEIVECLGSWSLKRLRAYARRTDPAPPLPAPDGRPALGPEPVVRTLPPRHPEADTTTELDAVPPSADGALPAGRSFVMANVLPGLAIIVDHDAPTLAKSSRQILANTASCAEGAPARRTCGGAGRRVGSRAAAAWPSVALPAPPWGTPTTARGSARHGPGPRA